jgi:alcohol dehydrogenase YqhD (iron-dependent ADH family)
MKNFGFHNPTKIYFGKGEVDKLGGLVKEVGSKVLLVYGKSSIKKIGLYDQVIKQLSDNNIEVVELSGVDPNPRVETVNKGADMCKKHNIELILAVGGGSVIDCSKAIGLAAKYDGDAWDIYSYKYQPTDGVPVASILTLSATGSEMNMGSVISNPATEDKNGFGSYFSYPVFSILDPENTYSVSKYQTGCGVVDTLTHVYEFYFSNEKNYLNNRVCEAIMKTAIHYGPIALQDPNNYEARANLMFASTIALNGISGFGKTWEGFNHTTEHVLSAYWDIAHGAGLAITGANWMKYILDDSTVDKFYEFAVNVWNVEHSKDKYKVAKEGIKKVWDFYESIGMPTKLHQVGIINPDLDKVSNQATRYGNLGNFKNLTKEDVKNILSNAL